MTRTSLLLSLLLALAQGPLTAHAKPDTTPAKKPPAGVSQAGAERAPLVARAAAAGKLAGAKRSGPLAANKSGGKPCYAKPVQLLRVRGVVVEPREVSLTMCDGTVNPAALDSVSVLARPRDVERPLLPEIRAYRARPLRKGKVAQSKAKKFRDPMFLTDKVMRVHPGLVLRLQKIAKHYPGKVIEIISGYRPDSRETSRHHHGHALDLRVAGVTREKLRDYLRSYEDTGVGYYPNSFFVHMDVREAKAYWVDRSGPGEPADYGPWPSNKQDDQRYRDTVLKNALADLAELKKPVVTSQGDRRTAMAGNAVATLGARAQPRSLARTPPIKDRVGDPEQEERGDDMRQDEVARVREEARRALEDL
jgi:uncharacterized protein YcbK (DUF882 family)